jgi:hypothetical protein
MAAEIDKTFTAIAKSTWHFLIENGQGCYIPAYQRPYSWDRDNIARLYEDVVHGIRQLAERPNTISFIGTIIAIHDTKYRTVDPMIRPEMPSRVMTIIDGQQRLCTVMMSNIALHDFVRMRVGAIAKRAELHFVWLTEQITELLAGLRNTYLIANAAGDGNYKFYPRMIRAYSDQWSRRQAQARYQSPMALLTWGYIDHTESGKTTEYTFKPTDAKKKPIPVYAAVQEAFRSIKSEIKGLCQGETKNHEFPDLVSASQSNEFGEGIWGHPLPEDVRKYLAEGSSDKSYPAFCELLRALIFAKYLNERVAITTVTTDSEDDAFDMFEALNTTGEPLTAFETFRPQVINTEGLSKYEHSSSRTYMIQIEAYLERFKKADDKQRATSEMLIPFALAETGTKLQKKLNDQRRYLRDEYAGLAADIEKARSFVRGLAGVAGFMQSGWDIERGREPHFEPLEITDEEAIVGFEALRGLKHTITVAPLARFYEHAVDGTSVEERKTRTDEFVAAIKATVAFSIYWRGAKGATENIDSYYRDIMRGAIKDGTDAIPALARRVDGKLGALSLANYKKALRIVLEKGGIKSKADWVKMAVRNPVYHHSRILARFMIFCAADDAMPDPAKKGLIIRGRAGVSPMLTRARWADGSYFTVEHIAPQSAKAGWDAKIYDEFETVHQLGNLTLLPGDENEVIANRSWEHKRQMYALLSAETQAEYDTIAAALGTIGLTLSTTAKTVLDNSKYLGLCKSLAMCDEPWTKEIIDQRSERLAELAWDRIHPWLYA